MSEPGIHIGLGPCPSISCDDGPYPDEGWLTSMEEISIPSSQMSRPHYNEIRSLQIQFERGTCKPWNSLRQSLTESSALQLFGPEYVVCGPSTIYESPRSTKFMNDLITVRKRTSTLKYWTSFNASKFQINVEHIEVRMPLIDQSSCRRQSRMTIHEGKIRG